MSRLHRGIAWRIVAGAASLLLWGRPAAAQFPPAPGTGPGLAETIEAIDSARVTTRILFITAHPDDEPAAVLTYLARGLHAEVALLTITRGEGGQNALGPEQAPQLGLIRTEELLAATRGYGVNLYFTRAPDFGYSKTPEETMKVWGDQVLEDIVRVIRTFRPHVVINGWGGVHGGHGHHQASGLLTSKAVQLAADPSYKLTAGLVTGSGTIDERPAGSFAPSLTLILERGSEKSKGYILPLDEISPFYGKSWREIGLDVFVNHRTQGIAGFLGSAFLRRPIAVIPEKGGSFDPAVLAKPLLAEGQICRAFSDADGALLAGREALLRGDSVSAVRFLADAANSAAQWLDKCPTHPAGTASNPELLADMRRIRQRMEKALALAAGIQVTAEADRSELVAGEIFSVREQARCRPEAKCAFGTLRLEFRGNFQEVKRQGDPQNGMDLGVAVGGNSSSALPGQDLRRSATAQESAGLAAWDSLQPEPPALILAEQTVTVADHTFTVRQPVTHIAATSTRIDRVPLRTVPAYTLAVEPKQTVEVLGNARKPFNVFVRVHSYATQASKASVGLDVPAGWMAGEAQGVEFSGQGDQYLRFTVTRPQGLAAGSYTLSAYAKRGEEKFTTSLEPLASLPTQLWSEQAECRVRAFDIQVPENLRVGYVTAEGEPIPEALGRLGIHVEMLDAAALAFGDLSKFDAIVVGVRAYELRPDLAPANARLLHYAEQGGTLVVQYNRDFIWDRLQPAPYPAKIGNPTPRITDENSPVRFLKPADALLNAPNKITQEDFQGWVQERGLYYWSQFDAKYTAVLAMNDPGEAELTGGLVYTRYGKGVYIYTGLAFFRQLPEGVPGAYRLFVNLLSASRAH
ncbi:MAG TPA: PIG-L family deacetylase [Candidatus Acidoferrales bacterium]|nr:PIG-L family deacetylase [Candidatus Acidoferrales bacterium]